MIRFRGVVESRVDSSDFSVCDWNELELPPVGSPGAAGVRTSSLQGNYFLSPPKLPVDTYGNVTFRFDRGWKLCVSSFLLPARTPAEGRKFLLSKGNNFLWHQDLG